MSTEKKEFKLEEAIAYRNKKSPKIQNIELAQKLFPDAKPSTQSVNMSKLVQGRTVRVSPEWVKTICEETGVDANFLFDIEPMEKPNE